MKFKRWRLRAGPRLVNAAVALALPFAITACGGSDDADAPTGETGAPETPAPPANELPAVWSTDPLDGPIRDMAVSGGAAPLLAVAYERIGLQFFNLSADRIADTAPYAVSAIADGRVAEIGGASVVLFPGVNADGDARVYIYGDGLLAPVEVALPIETRAAVLGLCSGPAEAGLFTLSYWTMDAPETLVSGIVSEVDEDFVWTETGAEPAGTSIGSCNYAASGPKASSTAAVATAHLERDAYTARLTINDEGQLFVAENGGSAAVYTVRDGITITAPGAPTALAALGRPLSGGYPGGVIILGGETKAGVHQAVFVDAAGLTRRGD